MSRDPNCVQCELSKTCITTCLWGAGTGSNGIMVVGEAPGKEEDNLTIPFVGQAGRILNRALDDAGLKRAECYITNGVKCRPPGNRNPEQSENKACRPYLQEEIDTIKPKIIVVLGNFGMFAVTGKKQVTKNRGKLLNPVKDLNIGQARIIATLHPAYALPNRGGDAAYQQIADDFKLAARMVGLGITPNLPQHDRNILMPGYTELELRLALSLLRNVHWLACDSEWCAPNDKEMTWPWSEGSDFLVLSFSGRIGERIQTVTFPWYDWAAPIVKEFLDV